MEAVSGTWEQLIERVHEAVQHGHGRATSATYPTTNVVYVMGIEIYVWGYLIASICTVVSGVADGAGSNVETGWRGRSGARGGWNGGLGGLRGGMRSHLYSHNHHQTTHSSLTPHSPLRRPLSSPCLRSLSTCFRRGSASYAPIRFVYF